MGELRQAASETKNPVNHTTSPNLAVGHWPTILVVWLMVYSAFGFEYVGQFLDRHHVFGVGGLKPLDTLGVLAMLHTCPIQFGEERQQSALNFAARFCDLDTRHPFAQYPR